MPLHPLTSRGNKRDIDFWQTSDTNPWRNIERTVRTVDEERVKDCTDDIDTLLVFAGLYSAVLTAFLVESYKGLQTDPTQGYLRQIALQTSSYTLTNGYLNSTFSLSQPPPFQAAKAAIRVNVCWFASLMLNLSSASFGILVKQWLREFLAISYISPQERIRIRDARVRGLESWKLFEIASFLPVILQISLALFFAGLCFFTSAVHSSIGIATLFLVSCWAFFFALSIIAPLVSPRCPYKTTLLKKAFRNARPGVRASIQIVRRVAGWFAHAAHPVFGAICWNAVRLYDVAVKFLQRLHAGHEEETITLDDIPSTDTTTGVLESNEYMDVQIVRKLVRCGLKSWEEEHEPRNATSSSLDEGLEEEDKLRTITDNDLVIFRNIDSSFFDDSLLAATQEALHRRPHCLRDTLRFVTEIVQSRLGFCPLEEAIAETGSTKKVPWPWTLSRIVRYALVNILADVINHELDHGPRIDWQRHSQEDSKWSTAFALVVFLLDPHEPIPRPFIHLFEGIDRHYSEAEDTFTYNPLDIFSHQMRTLTKCDSHWPARSFLFLARVLNTLKPQDAARCLRYIAHRTFVAPKGSWLWATYRRLLKRNPDAVDENVIAPKPQRLVALLECARGILHSVTLEQTPGLDEFPQSIYQLLEFVFNAIPKVQISFSKFDSHEPLPSASDDVLVGLYRVLTGIFTTPHTVHSLLNYFIKHPEHLLIPTDPSYREGLFSFPHLVGGLNLSDDENIQILSSCSSFFERNKIQLQRTKRNTLLRICYLVYGLTTESDSQICAHWDRMFAAATICFKISEKGDQFWHGTSCQDRHEDTCNAAFGLLLRVHMRHSAGHEEPDDKDINKAIAHSQVSDLMMDVLRRSVCDRRAIDPETSRRFWRIKRLDDLDGNPIHETVGKPSTRTQWPQTKHGHTIVSLIATDDAHNQENFEGSGKSVDNNPDLRSTLFGPDVSHVSGVPTRAAEHQAHLTATM